VRFLVDNALSPEIARGLAKAGHEAVHVRDLGLHAAEDEALFDLAAEQDRVIVSADTDFGTLLALRSSTKPSVILFRHSAARRPEVQVRLLLAQLDQLEEALAAGSLVAIEATRIRIRALPLHREG
jgi:predicted nuclease of predicted toxin-antitoxin system